MQGTLHNLDAPSNKPKGSPMAIAIAAGAILAVVAAVWFLLQAPQGPRVPTAKVVKLRMSPSEQEYRKKIEVGNLALSRAENFLHQEVTILSGEVYNGGAEPVSSLRLTAEFSDDMNQVVLRETRAVLGTPELALTARERRAFEISFEHMPNSWNMQKPVVRVEYLQLPSRK